MNLSSKEERDQPSWLGVVRRQVESLRFGAVQILVHESRVVQIERTEKQRFDQLRPGSGYALSGAAGETRGVRVSDQPL